MTATATVNTSIESELVESGEVGQDITHIGIWGGSSPNNYMTNFALSNNPSPLALGETVVFSANSLVLTLNVTEFSDYADGQALRGLFSSTRYFTYHTGSPGTSGTANRITGLSPTSVPTTSLTFA